VGSDIETARAIRGVSSAVTAGDNDPVIAKTILI
jgi:hypothetical protein